MSKSQISFVWWEGDRLFTHFPTSCPRLTLGFRQNWTQHKKFGQQPTRPHPPTLGFKQIWIYRLLKGMFCCFLFGLVMRNTESLIKYPTINYTGFSCNNMANYFDYQILANIFILKLKLCKNSSATFPIDILLMVMK